MIIGNTDISWIPLSYRKNLPDVKIIYEDFSDDKHYSGYYVKGKTSIVVVPHPYHTKDFIGTIAHEYLHFIQCFRGDIMKKSSVFNSKKSYNRNIRDYFHSQSFEMEALLFENKLAPTPTNNFWLYGLVLPKELDENLEM